MGECQTGREEGFGKVGCRVTPFCSEFEEVREAKTAALGLQLGRWAGPFGPRENPGLPPQVPTEGRAELAGLFEGCYRVSTEGRCPAGTAGPRSPEATSQDLPPPAGGHSLTSAV